MKSKISRCLLMIAVVSVLCVSSAFAQDNAKWTGTWKMIPEKSQFSGNGGPESIVIKFELKDSVLTETLTVGENGEEHSFTAKYSTDGKESTQEVMGKSAQTSAKWEGETLTIEFKDDRGGFRRKITLSPDGKTMMIAVRFSGDQGDRDESVVLAKQ